MSVINKMLRDLDARRTPGSGPDHPRLGHPTVMDGTLSVPTGLQAPQVRSRRWLVLLLLAGLLAVVAYHLNPWDTLPAAPAPVAMAPAVAVSEPVAPASEPVAAVVPTERTVLAPAPALVVAAAPAPGPSASDAAGRKNPRSESAAKPVTAAAPPVARDKEPTQRAASVSTAVAVPANPPPAAPAPVAPPVAAASAPAAAPPAQRRQTATQETLVQAQVLWSAGSREAALDLVREAVTVLERSPPLETSVLAPLVREQVRMELALGRPESVLAVLGRLEPALSTQADLWAVRGNAAQRLGRHQESVRAYQSALQLRPGESRWMLGAAVSHAALGQLDTAAQLAEQARTLGPVSPEVLAYLRQAGVPLR